MMWAFGLSFDGCSGGGASTQEAGSGGLAQFLVNVLEMSPGPLLWHPRPQAPLQRHVVSLVGLQDCWSFTAQIRPEIMLTILIYGSFL